MGIELLTDEQYRELQKLGNFDTKTSSWVKTPSDIRKLGGALFCDRRYPRCASGEVRLFNTADWACSRSSKRRRDLVVRRFLLETRVCLRCFIQFAVGTHERDAGRACIALFLCGSAGPVGVCLLPEPANGRSGCQRLWVERDCELL